jgi:retinol-binding protein 3
MRNQGACWGKLCRDSAKEPGTIGFPRLRLTTHEQLQSQQGDHHVTTSSTLDGSASATALIECILDKLRAQYVFPEIAAEVETTIRSRLSQGEYADLSTADLCATLTQQMQAISHDKHLRVFYSAEPRSDAERTYGTDEWIEFEYLSDRLINFGLQKAEVLPGNIGYLDIRKFCLPSFAGDTIVAAMHFLAHTSALIVDLRQCRGGDGSTVALLTSYFFTAPVHLNDVYWRPDNSTYQSWSLPYVPGKHYSDKPIFVLTSGFTFSAAEEFAYNLKNLKRATIVGEPTRGGAHPVERSPINQHIEVSIPAGRSINPISGGNWEGSGVQPDLVQPSEQAFQTAYQQALHEVLAGLSTADGGPCQALREQIQQVLDAM